MAKILNDDCLASILLILLTACLGATVWALLNTAGESASAPHATLPAMSIGEKGGANFLQAPTSLLALQTATLLVFAALMVLGIKPDRRSAKTILLVTVPILFYLTAWGAIFAFYLDYLASGETVFIIGMPVSSAIMIAAPWITIAFYCLIYFRVFDDAIFSKADQEAFEALLAEYGKADK